MKKCKCFIKAQNNEDTVEGVLFCMALIRLRLCKIKRVIMSVISGVIKL